MDATHPFATEVSANIRESTKGSGIPYLRLQRRMDDGICSIPENEGMKERAGTVHVFADYESCVQALTDTSGNILLTTGSKELAVFAPLKERLFVRVLPGLESIGLCEKAGIRGKQILAMQGPFSEEMNLAMIHQFSIRYLVTKASGAHSGFQEKLAAAQKAGITACVIGKQEQELRHSRFSGTKSGGIMTNPTVFGINGNSLMVGGEAGDEAILPLAEFYNKLNSILDKKLDAVQKSQVVYVTNHTYIDGDEIASRTVSKVDAEMVTNKRKGR